MLRSRVTIAAVIASLFASGSSHSTARQERRTPTPQSFTSTATAILVDVVVRDGSGRPVMDLSAADFEVAENRVLQKIDSFTKVSRGGGIGVGVAWRSPHKATVVNPISGSPAEGAAVSDEEATTALVFDHLSSESLRLAQKATLDYVPRSGESGVRVGVFATDPGIRVIEPYTTDRALVRRAVERIVPAGSSAQEQTVARADELVDRRRDLRAANEGATGAAATSTGAALAANSSSIGERETELRLIQMELNMIRSFDNLDREHQGYDAILGLVTVIQSLADVPGRKTIVFFSEGLPAAPGLSARLDHVIDVANRANVTTYAVDAKGLRARSSSTAGRNELNDFAEERLFQLTSGTDRSEQPLTRDLERVEDTLKLDSRTGLARLAEETGGFLIEESNDLSSAFRRIDEDNQHHYLLTYSPTNTAYDGKFRSIQVKVRRPGTRVFARKGYRAVRLSRTGDVGGYEVPALSLLERTPLPNAFPMHAASFSFPDPARPGLTPVLVRVRTNALRFSVDAERSTYSGQVSVIVRIRNAQGREVEKVSQQYLLTGEAKDLAAAKTGDILFYREPDLPAGLYTIESIVFDAIAEQGSVRIATLTVPAAQTATLGMSSLVLVNRVEEVSDPPKVGSAATPPLYVGNRLLYPNLGEPIRRSTASELPFYFTLYGNTDTVTAHAQILHNGRSLAEAPVELPRASGPRVQHVGRLPISALPAGTYELRIRVEDDRHELSRTAFFTMIE